MDIVGKRKIFLVVSAIISVICIVMILIFGFKLSIEFTGGSKLEIVSVGSTPIDEQKLRDAYQGMNVKIVSITKNSEKDFTVRTTTITDSGKNQILAGLTKAGISVSEKSFDTLGPVVGKEAQANALKAVLLAVVAITVYIAFAFRKVSQPVSSWKFGISAIIALLHDVIIVLGVFSFLGVVFDVEIDTLFITAVLTIMGFSVHDTIVVFDRIRENLIKNVRNLPFDQVVNKSFNETLARSLNTSLTVVLVLFALLLFGGESIRWFIVAFIVGIVAGTYSSIFVASSILVEWYFLDKKGFKFSNLLPRRKKKK